MTIYKQIIYGILNLYIVSMKSLIINEFQEFPYNIDGKEYTLLVVKNVPVNLKVIKEQFPNLRTLCLNNNNLHSMTELSGLQHLTSLYMDNNHITKIQGNLDLVQLSLRNNKITDMSGVS